MQMEEKIKSAIEGGLSPHHIQLINESHKHIGHAGDNGSGQTHFKLMVVSDVFAGCSRVQRQRLVNRAITGLFEEGLHAISIKTYTLEEFNK